jgi:Beta xylosidase C-terminal Concanavalin A-like domain
MYEQKNKTFFFLCYLFLVVLHAHQTQSDNENETYSNPVIAIDFPDIDVFRLDLVYNMITTTMFIFPSVTIFTGNKFCMFNYPAKETGGYVDFDWFHMQPVFQ